MRSSLSRIFSRRGAREARASDPPANLSQPEQPTDSLATDNAPMAEVPNPDGYTIPFQMTKGMHRDLYDNINPSNPALSAKGKVLVISGPGSGVGHKIVQAWSTAGAAGFVLFGRKSADLEGIAASLKVPALVVLGSVTSEKDSAAAFEKAVAKFGHVDCLVNCAGSFAFGTMTGQVEPSTWWNDHEVNVKGSYIMSHYFIKATGGKGTIINVVSIDASFLSPGVSSYATSKLAVIKLGELLEVEHPELRVFSVHPGVVEAEDGRGAILAPFTPFAKDKARLTGAVSLYLMTSKADFLKGGFISVNWDLNELEEHKAEVMEKRLVKLGFLNGQLQPGGYTWSA